jgi:hypothetical protein
MTGGTKVGFSTISLERLQCARQDSAGPQKEDEERFSRFTVTVMEIQILTGRHIRRLGRD